MNPVFSSSARVALCLVTLGFAACSSLDVDKDYESKEQKDLYKNGSLLSDNGGAFLLGGNDKNTREDGGGMGVNGYLWRATLDTVAFMPIAAADPFGGVITTDWYAAPATPGERAKLNIFILGRDLRADGVRVTVFRQTKDAAGQWVDAASNPATASQLEETILTRARQLKMAQRDLPQ